MGYTTYILENGQWRLSDHPKKVFYCGDDAMDHLHALKTQGHQVRLRPCRNAPLWDIHDLDHWIGCAHGETADEAIDRFMLENGLTSDAGLSAQKRKLP